MLRNNSLIVRKPHQRVHPLFQQLAVSSVGHVVRLGSSAPNVLCSAKKRGGSQAQVAEQADETIETPFFEPAVRAFSLGFGSGVLLELAHVASKVFATGVDEGLGHFPAWMFTNAEAMSQLAPIVAWDNLAAVSSCVLFYMIEVAAILSVMQQFPDDARKAAEAITRMPTLPKRLMPLRLSAVKRTLYALIALRWPFSPGLQGAGEGAAAPPATTTATTTANGPEAGARSRPLAFVDDGPGRGAAVQDRPAIIPPGLGAPGAPLPPFPRPDAQPGRRSGPATKDRRSNAPGSSSRPSTAPPGPPITSPGRRAGLAPGAWDPTAPLPGNAPAFLLGSKRAKELRDRRAYLKNFWYAAALSQALGEDAPLEVQLLGRKVVLWRDSDTGVVRCLDNACPHRGAPLGRGWLKDAGGHSCVVCPYHGWALDGEGRLREVPSSADQRHLPRRPLVGAYPVEERGGFIWLFFGSSALPADELPPIPWTPELNMPGWTPVYGEMEFDAPHWNVFDNALDMAHIHYLHGDSFGNSSKPVIQDMSMRRGDYAVHGSFRIHNKPVSPLWDWTAVESVPVEYSAHLPSTSSIKISLGAGVQMITFVNTVPVSASRAINRFCLIRNFAGWEGFDRWARNAMFKILSEDKVMVEQLQPEVVPLEVSLEADRPQIAFRRLRQSWVDVGYSVDPEDTELHTGSLDL
ncbi:hypothetical protein V8C86DRAFT_1683936 [Haematococcus lacustris]